MTVCTVYCVLFLFQTVPLVGSLEVGEPISVMLLLKRGKGEDNIDLMAKVMMKKMLQRKYRVAS